MTQNFFELFLRMFNCVILFCTVPRFSKRGGLWLCQITSTPTYFMCLSQSGISSLCMSCFVFTFSLLYVAGGLFRCTCILCCFGASLSLSHGVRVSSSFIDDPWVALRWHFFMPVGLLSLWHIHHIHSPYIIEVTIKGDNQQVVFCMVWLTEVLCPMAQNWMQIISSARL